MPQSFEQLAEGPIFLVGHPRSGTTWVYDILTAHPQVAGILESWIFSASGGLSPLFGAEHWSAESRMLQRGIEPRPIGLSQMVTREELASEVRRLVERLMARRLDPSHRFLVEKTPTPYTDIGVVAEVFPDARFLHVIRDGRDMAVSLRAAALAWNPGWSQFAGAAGRARYRALYRAGRSWHATLTATREVGERLDDRYTEIRYETISADPRQAIGRIFDFARIPYDARIVGEVFERTDFHRHFPGGEDRFRRGGRVGDWRRRFGVLDAVAFELGAKRGLVEVGYEPRRLLWILDRVPLRGHWT